MSRYLERAEHTSRVLDVQINLMLERGTNTEQRWHRVVEALGIRSEPQAVVTDPQTLFFSPTNRSSIVHCVNAARENGRQIREQISSEMWLQLNRLFHDSRAVDFEGFDNMLPLPFLRDVRERCYLFRGVTDATMSHSDAWHFIQLGMGLERAILLASLLEAYAHDFSQHELFEDVNDFLEWVAMLRSCAALEAYTRYSPTGIQPQSIVQFVILDPEFPHSIRFAVDLMARCLAAVSGVSQIRRRQRLDRLIGRLQAFLTYTELSDIRRQGLLPFLSSIKDQCFLLHAAIYDAYIAYPVESALEA